MELLKIPPAPNQRSFGSTHIHFSQIIIIIIIIIIMYTTPPSWRTSEHHTTIQVVCLRDDIELATLSALALAGEPPVYGRHNPPPPYPDWRFAAVVGTFVFAICMLAAFMWSLYFPFQ
jgi:hypothetical protein